jgi:rod shape determining protein RodA
MSWARSSTGLGTRGTGGSGGAYGKLAPVRPEGRWNGMVAAPRSLLQRSFAKGSPLRHLDWTLLVVVLALSLAGTLLVWSATEGALRQQGSDPHTYLYKQLVNVVIGLALMWGVTLLDYRRLRSWAPALYGVALLGLIAVLAVGKAIYGSKSWIDLPGGNQVEPSEFGKLAIILMAASFLSTMRQPGGRPTMRAVALTLAMAAVPIALVVKEPDLGVTILMLVMVLGLIALSGIKLRWLVLGTGAGALSVLAVFKLHLLKAYQLARLTSFLHPSANPLGNGYSAAQAKLAIGSGGLLGQGLFHGSLITGNYIPNQETDFVFAVAGDQLGFVGAAAIIALLFLLLIRALRIAARADDVFGMLVASGVVIWFAVQSFINIGMTIGIMPVTGLPLPFVSYGGSAMFADMIAIGALQSVHRHHSVFGYPRPRALRS